MNILYVSPLANACTYYRCTLPARHLNRLTGDRNEACSERSESISSRNEVSSRKARRIEASHAPERFMARVVSSLAKEYFDWADLVVLQRVVGDLMYHIVRYCKLAGKKVIYEVDDNIFMYPDSPEYKKDGIQAETVSAIKILRNCDAVTTTTEAIRSSINELVDTPVYVLPNQIDFSDLERLNFSSQRQFSIGWAGGHYHVQDLSLIEPALEELLERYPDVLLIMYGACPEGLYARNKTRIFFQPFMPVEEFHFWMAAFRFDVGLAPLYQTEFARSRSNLRLLQYAATKIPMVASDWGEYGKALTNGLAGLVARADEWVEKVGWLIENPQEREQLSQRAYQYVSANYDMEKNVHLWEDCYREVMG